MDLDIINEAHLESLFPIKIQKLSSTHWTPVDIAKTAITYLTENQVKSVLDLGSGSGKFCFVAAACSTAEITGVEQRHNLVQLARKIAKTFDLQNLKFIHGDLIDLDFNEYESFYFFNAFEELINSKDKLDKSHERDEIAHQEYIKLIREKFEQLPIGTRIVTYFGETNEIPDSYRLTKSDKKGKLKFWEKQE